MSELYQRIHTRLEQGQASRLVSRYSPAGIERRLIEEDNTDRDTGGLSFEIEGDTLTLTERFAPRPRLVILGGGHISLPLCAFAKRLGFEIWLYDDRPSFANPDRFPEAHTVICDDFARLHKRLNLRESDYVTILTRGHKHDILCLESLLRGEVPHYIGMIGSKRRIAIVKKEIAAKTNCAGLLGKFYAPIGLEIGSVTPEEIALSIMAEIIKLKRLGRDGQGSKKPQEGSMDKELLRWLAEADKEKAALVTIVETSGSTPREIGAKMAVTLSGHTIGSLGGGCAEAEAIIRARDVIDQNGYHLLEIDLADSAEEEGMVCGGHMQILVEAI